MQLLLIGLDGAQPSTFKRGWTPYLESIIEKSAALYMKEDLISRGWAEILTGEHASATGAMYERPVLDGAYSWTDKFKLNDIPGLGKDVKPLWQVLNERGYRVGVMNVPTTNPAPKVDGFFVSGGGGGGGIRQGVMAAECYPENVVHLLNEQGYILDERLPSLLGEKKLYDPAAFFLRLEEMNERRTRAFIELSKQHGIDFGFVVFKSSIVTTETLLIPELDRHSRGGEVNNYFIASAEKFYRNFDNQVQQLVQNFPEAEIVLVSDHGMVPRRWSVNLNGFLIEKGFQKQSTSRRGVFDLVKTLRHWIPISIRQKLKSNPQVKSAYQSMISFNPKKSHAFNITITNAIHGIYINDKDRFGGPVQCSDIDALKEKITTIFNEHPEVVKHGMVASIKPAPREDGFDIFPDILVEMADGYTPSNIEPGFITEYVPTVTPINLGEMGQDKRESVKGHYPLAIIIRGEWRVQPRSGREDLRLIYDHVLSAFPDKKNVI